MGDCQPWCANCQVLKRERLDLRRRIAELEADKERAIEALCDAMITITGESLNCSKAEKIFKDWGIHPRRWECFYDD